MLLYLLTVCIICNHQIIVSITVTSSKISDMNYNSMQPFIYQYVMNLVVFFHKGIPSLFINVAMWEHCTLDRFLDVANFTITPLSFLRFYKLSFLTVGLKIKSFATFSLESM